MATIYGSSSGGKKYTIGSQTGQDFVNNAKPGATLTGADGSTWTKNSDGSTTIVQNGVSYNVGGSSSKPSGSSGSSGGSSSGGSSGGSSGSFGYTGGFRDYSKNPTGTWDPNAPKYTGGNAELDAYLAQKSQEYFAAKANNDARGMAEANDAANQARNYFGYAAELATDDINKVVNSGSPTGIYGGGAGVGGFGGGSYGGQVNDLSNYLEEMYAEQRKAALASIDSAYKQNLNAIDRAGQGVSGQYQSARNQAAGASELAARNFAEYAAAYGLGSGATGQAELARNVALQNDLNALNTEEAQTYADLELQRANAETAYNSAIAEAEANNNSELAAALYQEKVRVQNELIAQQQQLFENSLAERQFQYQQQQAQISNDQWQQSFDYQKEQDAAAQAEQNRSYLAGWGETMLSNGFMPTEEMLAAMGMTSSQANAVLNAVRAQSASTYSSSGGQRSSGSTSRATAASAPSAPSASPQQAGSSSGGSNGYRVDTNSVLALGYGPIDSESLAQKEASGEISSYIDGNLIKFVRNTTPNTQANPVIPPFLTLLEGLK